MAHGRLVGRLLGLGMISRPHVNGNEVGEIVLPSSFHRATMPTALMIRVPTAAAAIGVHPI